MAAAQWPPRVSPRTRQQMTQPRQGPPELSVVVPLYNEEESLNQLAEQILAVWC